MSIGYGSQFEVELRKLLDEEIATGTERVVTVGSAASNDFPTYQRALGAIAAFKRVRDELCDLANKRVQER